MTPSELKFQHEQNFPESHFFNRDTMKFFGDSMKNYGVHKLEGNVLELYRKNPVKNGLQKSVFFCGKEFKILRNIA